MQHPHQDEEAVFPPQIVQTVATSLPEESHLQPTPNLETPDSIVVDQNEEGLFLPPVICKSLPWKYTCPACSLHFCSLDCSKIHKANTKCSGERNKAKMIDLKKFTDSDVISDFKFLQDNKGVVQNANRYRTKHRIYEIETQDSVFFIQKRALYKGVLMRLMPEGMYKRRKNTTHYINKNDLLCWRSEFIFGDIKIEEKGVPETDTLKFAIENILNNPVKKQGLEKYVLASQEDPISYNVYMKVENLNGDLFYKLDPLCTIANQLRYREVIEYPVFHVYLQSEIQPNVISVDLEKTHKDVVRKETSEIFRHLPRSFGKPDFRDEKSNRGHGGDRGSFRGSRGDRGSFRGYRGDSRGRGRGSDTYRGRGDRGNSNPDWRDRQEDPKKSKLENPKQQQ